MFFKCCFRSSSCRWPARRPRLVSVPSGRGRKGLTTMLSPDPRAPAWRWFTLPSYIRHRDCRALDASRTRNVHFCDPRTLRASGLRRPRAHAYIYMHPYAQSPRLTPLSSQGTGQEFLRVRSAPPVPPASSCSSSPSGSRLVAAAKAAVSLLALAANGAGSGNAAHMFMPPAAI